MIESFLLAVPYLLGVAAIFAIAWAIGGLWLRGAESFFEESVRAVLGIATMTFSTATLGLCGLLFPRFGLPLVALLAVGGLLRAGLRFRRPNLSALPWPVRAILIVPAYIVVSASLVPDLSQDSMWYHLSMPGQWRFSGTLEAMPSVMTSAYPLGTESLYALLLPLGGAELCSAFYAGCILLLWAMLLGAVHREAPGWPTALCALVWIPMHAVYAPVPLPATNDMVAALLLTGALALLFLPWMRTGSAPPVSRTLCISFLLGQAISAKPVTLPFSCVAIAVAVCFVGGSVRSGMRLGALLSAGAFVSYAPWALRGIVECGTPMFPLFTNVFTLHEEFVPAFVASRSLNTLYPITVDGLYAALVEGIPRKLYLALGTAHSLFVFVPMISTIGLVAFRGRDRVLAILILGMFLPVALLLHGANEIIRYIAICYPLAAVVLALLAKRSEPLLSARLHTMLLVVLPVVAFGHYAAHTIRFATMPTVRWPFRPLLAEEDVGAYARRSEIPQAFFAYRAMQPIIPVDAKVFVPDFAGPFHLHRRALWNDYAVAGVAERWRMFAAKDALSFLRAERIEWIAIVDPGALRANVSVCEELVRAGALEQVAVETGHSPALLYRVAAISTAQN